MTSTQAQKVGRFAPSPTGPAHPGTLLSGLLAWLEARAAGARFILRIEDIDPNRARDTWAEALLDDLTWFGLDWDEVVVQSERGEAHAEALDVLASLGRLYGCTCTRAQIKATASLAADGGRRYPGTCRDRRLGPGQWQTFEGAVRFALPNDVFDMRSLRDDGPIPLCPAEQMGDPIVRRKDGACAYNLVVVVDDIACGVDRIVRGSDLLPCTGIHLALYAELGALPPAYWHHPLLLEPRPGRSGDALPKLAKLHGSVGAAELRQHLTAQQLCGFLASCVGLGTGEATTPHELLTTFAPGRVADTDRVVTWADGQLLLAPLP